MRWKKLANKTVFVVKETVDVKSKLERRNIPKIGIRSYSTPSENGLFVGNNGPGILYLIEHDHLDAFKIGMSSSESRNDRIQEHRVNGWSTIEVWPSETVQAAYVLEQTVINWWRKSLNAPAAVNPESMPQGGYTETISRSVIDKEKILEFIYEQLGDSLVRPALSSSISDLKIGMRSIIEGTVKVAILDVVYVGSFRGKSKYQPIYRYKVTDGTGEIVIESFLSRTRAKKVDARHVKAPVEGGKVRIEGRVLSIDGNKENLGMIDPLVIGDQVNPWSGDHRIYCGTCSFGKYTIHVKRYGRKYETFLVCKKCRRPIKVSELR